MARRMVQVYADFATDVAAMPVVVGACPTTIPARSLLVWEPLTDEVALASQAGRAPVCGVPRAQIAARVLCGRG